MSTFFSTQSSLPPDAPSYVERPADGELLRLCQEGQLAYVLAPRQSGKSSLVLRTQARLQAQGVHTAYIDLESVGVQNVTPEQWYLSLLTELATKLGLGVDPVAWWTEHEHLTAVKRFTDFQRQEVVVGSTAASSSSSTRSR